MEPNFEFCEACAILDETARRFGHLFMKTEIKDKACPFNETHILQTEVDGLPQFVTKVMYELMEAEVIPGAGFLLLTYNDNFIVFRSL